MLTPTYDFKFTWDFNPMIDKNKELIKLTIHYDQLFNDDHEMELGALATSWQGLAKLLIGITEFSCSGRMSVDSSNVKVTTKATLTKGSLLSEIYVYVKDLGLFEGSGSNLITLFLSWIFCKRQEKKISSQDIELEYLKLNNQKLFDQLNKQQTINDTNTALLESMHKQLQLSQDEIKALRHDCDNLAKSFNEQHPKLNTHCRHFLSPINTQCKCIEGLINNEVIFKADSSTKELFIKQSEIVDVTNCTIELRKLDKKNGSCTVIYTDPISSKEIIIPATITDLKFFTLNNDYLDSFANRSTNDKLKVNGQLIVNEEGVPIRLNIQEISKIS